MDAARVESRPDRRAEYVVGETEAGGEKDVIGETSNGRASSWDWPKVGVDDCRPNGGGSHFRTLETCWTPLLDILHASGRRTWTGRPPSRSCEWVDSYALFRDGRPTVMSQMNWFRLQSTPGWRTPHPVASSTERNLTSQPRRTGRPRKMVTDNPRGWMM